MDAKEFEKATGRKPEQDDLERVNCPDSGDIGHLSCGWCDLHQGPMFECGCGVRMAGIKAIRHLRV